MSGDAPSTTLASRWKRLLEAGVLLMPAAYAVLAALFGVITILPKGNSAASKTVGAVFAVVWVGIFLVSLLLWILTPIALFFDAKAVNEAGLEWEPNAVLYAIGGVFLSGLVALHYLYMRYEHTADGNVHAWTAYLVGQFLVVAPLSAVLLVVLHPVMVTPLALSFGLFLIGIYRDAAYVRTRTDEWLPNPVNYYLVGVFGILMFGVGPLILAAFYIYRRQATIGLP